MPWQSPWKTISSHSDAKGHLIQIPEGALYIGIRGWRVMTKCQNFIWEWERVVSAAGQESMTLQWQKCIMVFKGSIQELEGLFLDPEDKPCICVVVCNVLNTHEHYTLWLIFALNEHRQSNRNDDVLFKELTDTTAHPLPGRWRNLDNPFFAALGCFISDRQSLMRSDRSQKRFWESCFSFTTVFCETRNFCTTKVSKPLDIMTLNNPGLFIIFSQSKCKDPILRCVAEISLTSWIIWIKHRWLISAGYLYFLSCPVYALFKNNTFSSIGTWYFYVTQS